MRGAGRRPRRHWPWDHMLPTWPGGLTSGGVRPGQVGSGGGTVRQRCALVQPSQTGRGSPPNPPGSQKFWPPAGAGGGERAPSPGPPDAPQAGQGWGDRARPCAELSGTQGARSPHSPRSQLGVQLINRRILCCLTSLSPAGSYKID